MSLNLLSFEGTHVSWLCWSGLCPTQSPLKLEAVSCSALIWRSQCAPLWREKRDGKMLSSKTSLVLAGIRRCLGLQVQAFAALSVPCCPRSWGAGMPVMPAAWLTLEEEAKIGIQLPWP